MSTELTEQALTTVERMKTRLSITDTQFDSLLERLIMGVTDHLQSLCNKKFVRTTYTNEIYTIHNSGADMVALNQTPVISIASLQYRSGGIATPVWTSFTGENYELSGDGKSGLVRVYGGVPRGTNALRATYTAGYLIDFGHPTDITKHTLPFDLSDLTERLVTKRFKKRDHEGKINESFDGGQVTWDAFIDKDDREIVSRYSRLPSFT